MNNFFNQQFNLYFIMWKEIKEEDELCIIESLGKVEIFGEIFEIILMG